MLFPARATLIESIESRNSSLNSTAQKVEVNHSRNMADPDDDDDLVSISQLDLTAEPNVAEEKPVLSDPLEDDDLVSISQLDLTEAQPNVAEEKPVLMPDPIEDDDLLSISQFDVTKVQNQPNLTEEKPLLIGDEDDLLSISQLDVTNNAENEPIVAGEEEIQGENGQYYPSDYNFDDDEEPLNLDNEVQGEVEYQYIRRSSYESGIKKFSWMKTLPPDEDEKVKLTPQLISRGLSSIGRVIDSPEMAYTKFVARGLHLELIEMLSKYPHLRNVDLSENSLTDVQALAPMRYLQVLNLEQNRISAFSDIPHFKWLQALNVKENDLLSLDGIQPSLLTYLNLSNNYIFSAEYFNGQQFPNLLLLELRSNELNSIAEMQLPKLQHLYLCQNMLRDLDGLQNCPNLELIHARGNLIEFLTDFPNLPKLKYLNLRNNSMRRFTETAFLENSENIETIILTENPISQSERYRAEIAAVALSIKRLDKTIVTEAEKIEGRLLRSARMMNVIEPLEDDQSVLGEMEVGE